jgi:hypothetical protein
MIDKFPNEILFQEKNFLLNAFKYKEESRSRLNLKWS